MTRVLLSWSSGKDSAWALHCLRADPRVEVAGLVTTINREADRVAMHAVRRELLERQAAALALPIEIVPLPHPASNEDYERAMRASFAAARERGVDAIAYGDLHLADVREYREKLMQGSGLDALFPLWGEDTPALARRMVDAGLSAVVTCVDTRQLAREFGGRRFDHAFLDALPADVDPCGENGEFHSFVTAGPMLREPVDVVVGEALERDGFLYTDLRPAQPREPHVNNNNGGSGL